MILPIVVIFIVLYFSFGYLKEDFSNNMIGSQLHASIMGNSIRYVSYKPPSAHGEYGCTQVPCPDNIDNTNLTCWCCNRFH